MNPADDALNGRWRTTIASAPEDVIYLKFVADRASSIDDVVIALEETVKFLRRQEDEGYVLAEPVDGGRVCMVRP